MKQREHHDSMGLGCLGDSELSINYYNGSYGQMHINRKLSNEIISNGLLRCYVTKMDDKIFLTFESEKGRKVTKYKSDNNHCIVCSSVVWGAILEHFRISDMGRYRVKLSKNLAKKDGVITIQIVSVFLLDDLQGVRAAVSMSHPEQSAVVKREDILISIIKEETAKTKDPDIETCIRVLKEAGYKVMKPVKKIDYVTI